MRNRGIGRGRVFMGSLLLFAAIILWAVTILMSPHGQAIEGADAVRNSVVVFIRNSAIGTLVMCALAGWLLLPLRLVRWPARHWAIVAAIAVMVLTSLYQLIWLRSVVH